MKLLLAIGFLLLAGCAAAPPQQAEQNYSARIGIVNHTGNFIYSAVVNGAGGGNMSRWGAGMADVCCASVPHKWYPGMTVHVQWDMPEGAKHVLKEKTVEVEKYDEPGSIYLHFFPNDQVRVLVSPYDGASPKHPIRRPQNPVAQLQQ